MMTWNSKTTRLGVVKEQGTRNGGIELDITVQDLISFPFLNIEDLGDGDRGSEIRFPYTHAIQRTIIDF